MNIDVIDFFMTEGKVEREEVRGYKTPDGIRALKANFILQRSVRKRNGCDAMV